MHSLIPWNFGKIIRGSVTILSISISFQGNPTFLVDFHNIDGLIAVGSNLLVIRPGSLNVPIFPPSEVVMHLCKI